MKEQYNLKINQSKTKTLAFRGRNLVRSKIVIEGETIEQVRDFNYLGSWLSHIESKDIEDKMNKMNMMCGTIKRTLKNKCRPETQLKFYKVMAVPVGLYASETWTLRKVDEQRIQTAEMRFLRSVRGVTRRDRLRNEDIRADLGVHSLKSTIAHKRDNWLHHVDRMGEDRYPKKALAYRPQGRRNIGRPKKRWSDQN